MGWVFTLYFIIIIEYYILLMKRDKKNRNIKDGDEYKMLLEYKILFILGLILFIAILVLSYIYIPYFHEITGIIIVIILLITLFLGNSDNRINSVEEFSNIYKNAIIVNYDYANIKGYGVVYRTSTGSLETVRNDNPGEYLIYPYIQQFQKGKNVNTKIFIIYKNNMYEIERIEKDNPLSNYKIIHKLTNINKKFYKDSEFNKEAKKPICNEPILKIIE